MPEFLELSIVPEWVEPTPLRRFCIHADATFRELRDAVLILTGWKPSKDWVFIIPMLGGEIMMHPRPPRLRQSEPGEDPDVTPVSYYLDPGFFERLSCRYYHDLSMAWRVDVIARERWNVLDHRRRWLVMADDPWPPFELEDAKRYSQLLEGLRTWSDPDGVVSYAREVLRWSPELDVQALERRFNGR